MTLFIGDVSSIDMGNDSVDIGYLVTVVESKS